MLTTEGFIELLKETEAQTIDFKRDPYDLSGVEGRGSLIKDILSMANTPRTGPAYIVLGVKAHADGSQELVGLSTSVDDNEYQSAVRSKVYPSPTFLYVPIQYEDNIFGVLVIPIERRGPFQAIEDVGKKVRRYVIYWRRGSQNDEAKPDEQDLIRRWCAGEVQKPIEMPGSPSTPWEKLLDKVHYFEEGRVYVLVAGPFAPDVTSRLAGFADAPWNFIIDFDPSSVNSGFALAVQPHLRHKTVVREVVLGDRPTIRVESSCGWYYARGLVSRVGTLSDAGWAAWKRKYGLDIAEQMRALAESRGSRPVSIISIWNSEDYIDTIFSAALDLFGDAVDFTVAHPEARTLVRTMERFGAELVQIDPAHFAEALHSLYADERAIAADSVQLPTKSGTRVALSAEDQLYLEEELEIVGISAGTVAEEERDICEFPASLHEVGCR